MQVTESKNGLCNTAMLERPVVILTSQPCATSITYQTTLWSYDIGSKGLRMVSPEIMKRPRLQTVVRRKVSRRMRRRPAQYQGFKNALTWADTTLCLKGRLHPTNGCPLRLFQQNAMPFVSAMVFHLLNSCYRF
jgi:hypothetical protein